MEGTAGTEERSGAPAAGNITSWRQAERCIWRPGGSGRQGRLFSRLQVLALLPDVGEVGQKPAASAAFVAVRKKGDGAFQDFFHFIHLVPLDEKAYLGQQKGLPDFRKKALLFQGIVQNGDGFVGLFGSQCVKVVFPEVLHHFRGLGFEQLFPFQGGADAGGILRVQRGQFFEGRFVESPDAGLRHRI